MKIKINIEKDGKLEEREVIINLKGKHQKEFLKKIGDIAKKTNKEEVSEDAIAESIEFLEYQDRLLDERSDLTKEEIDDLDLEEKNKLLKAMRELLLPWSQSGFF